MSFRYRPAAAPYRDVRGLMERETAARAGLRFTATDTGRGLAAEDQPYVFERFWQARRVRRGGVGPGLPITNGIVDAPKGRVRLEGSPGAGTTFHFTLPLAARRLQ